MDDEKAFASRELEWLVSSLDETISALRSGLEEIVSLLDTDGPGSTLPLSTSRSEALKGVITRVGSRITRGDMQVKMFGLAHTRGLQAYKITLALPTADRSLILEQLVDVNNYVISSLELLRSHMENGAFVKSMDPKSVMEKLCTLQSNVLAARTALKGPSPHRLFPFHAIDPKVFEPPLPVSVAFDLYISEAAIIAELRTLDPMAPPDPNKSAFLSLDMSPFGFRERFAAAVGVHRDVGPRNAETNPDKIFAYNGVEVKVREMVRVESQDPSLMAAWAKLGGLEHVLGMTIRSLRLVMTAAGIE